MIRQPAVADLFYPGNSQKLQHTVQTLLQSEPTPNLPVPKAIIAPHAGYIYSGPVAASVYRRLYPAHNVIKKVILLGPSHRVHLYGCACSSASAFVTPLGEVALDRQSIDQIKTLPYVHESDDAHHWEHSLEVHLPFLQTILDDFSLVPIVVGECAKEKLAQMLDMLWGGPETLIVVSSDLSHYHDYDTAKHMDASTCQAIESLDLDRIDSQHACGAVPVKGLLHLVKQKALQVTTVDCRNSGDTAGPRNEVVGYASFTIE